MLWFWSGTARPCYILLTNYVMFFVLPLIVPCIVVFSLEVVFVKL